MRGTFSVMYDLSMVFVKELRWVKLDVKFAPGVELHPSGVKVVTLYTNTPNSFLMSRFRFEANSDLTFRFINA